MLEIRRQEIQSGLSTQAAYDDLYAQTDLDDILWDLASSAAQRARRAAFSRSSAPTSSRSLTCPPGGPTVAQGSPRV